MHATDLTQNDFFKRPKPIVVIAVSRLLFLGFLLLWFPILTFSDSADEVNNTVFVQKANLAPNPGFEETFVEGIPDALSGGWKSAETSLPADALKIVQEKAFGGESALRLDASTGCRAAHTYPLRLEPQAVSCWASAWICGASRGTVLPVIIWYGRKDRAEVELGRTNATVEEVEQRRLEEGGWHKIVLEDIPRPEGADHMAFGVQLAQDAAPDTVIFIDDIEIRYRVEPQIQVLVNQAGYDPTGSKRILVLSNVPFTNEEGENIVNPPGHFTLVDPSGERPLFQSTLRSLGEIKGWDFWAYEGDGASFIPDRITDATYCAVTTIGGQTFRSEPFYLQPRLLEKLAIPHVLDFFRAQRCGCEIPEWLVPGAGHPPCHLDDAITEDGAHGAVGGWHDGAEYTKNSANTAEACYALLLSLSERPDLFGAIDKDGNGQSDALDEAEWGLAYLQRVQDAQSGALWEEVSGSWQWGPSHTDTDNLPETGDERRLKGAPGTGNHGEKTLVAALAILGRLKPDSGALQQAIELEQKQGTDARGYLELWRSSRDTRYQQKLFDCVRAQLQPAEPQNKLPDAETLLRYTLLDPRGAKKEGLAQALQRHMMLVQTRCPAPFYIEKTIKSDGHLAYGRPYPHPDAWYIGSNMDILQTATESALAARLGMTSASALEQAQVDWLLGLNPYGISMIEAIGSNIPHYHHRLDIRLDNPRGAIPGTVIHGMVRLLPKIDRPWLDLSEEPNTDWRTNAPWLPLQAKLLVFIASLP